MKNQTKKPTESNISEIEKAKQLILEQNLTDQKNCVTELNEAMQSITKKYGCRIIIAGHFEGATMQTSINCIKM